MMPTEKTTLLSSRRSRGLIRGLMVRRSFFPLSAVALLSAVLAGSTVIIEAFEATTTWSIRTRSSATTTARHYAPATASPVYSDHHTSRTTNVGGGALILDHADTDVSSKMMTITKQQRQMIHIDASSTTTALQASIQRRSRRSPVQLMQMGSSSTNSVKVQNQPKIKMGAGGQNLQVKNTSHGKNQASTSSRRTRHMVSSSSRNGSSSSTVASGNKAGAAVVVRTTTPTPRNSMTAAASASSKQRTIRSSRDYSSAGASGGLTREEEVQFSFQIRTLRAAVRLRDQMMMQASASNDDIDNNELKPASRPPTNREWAQACGTTVSDLRRLLYEGQEARTAMCNANVGLVTSIAKRHYHGLKEATRIGDGYSGGGSIGTILTCQDFIQEGNLGLMEAAERFEPEKGFRFSTYATYWIRQRILRSISDSSRTIRLPAHVHGILQKIHKAKRSSRALLGREPTLQELAQQLEMSPVKVQMYTESSRNVVSLELPLNNGGGSFKNDRIFTLGDTLASDAPTPEEDAQADYLRRDVAHVIQTELTERERAVLQCRFGLCPKSNHQARTVAETAQELGLTSDRVRLVEARALNKLRHPQRNYRLKEYVVNDSHYHFHSHHHTNMEENNNLQSSSWGLTKTAATTATTLSRRQNVETRTVVEGYDLATPSISGFSSTTTGTATLDKQHHQDTHHHHRSDRRWFF